MGRSIRKLVLSMHVCIDASIMGADWVGVADLCQIPRRLILEEGGAWPALPIVAPAGQSFFGLTGSGAFGGGGPSSWMR
jgi:hypothetical protein